MTIAAFFSSTAISAFPQAAKPKWSGTVEIIDGVATVRNPKVPLYGTVRLELAEEFRIGSADDPQSNFYRIRDVKLDQLGNIYVADMGNKRVQKFDPNGKFLVTFGRGGQGPGEFEQPTRLAIDNKTGIVYVLDQSWTLETFKPDGTPIQSLILDSSIGELGPGPSGELIINFKITSEKGSLHRLCRISSDGKIIRIYAEAPYTQIAGASKIGNFGITHGYETGIHFGILGRESIIFGDSGKYGFSIADMSGNIRLRVEREAEKRPLPASFKKAMNRSKERIGFLSPIPDSEPFFYGFLTDDADRVYVQTNKTWAEENVSFIEADVFSRDGYFLFQTRLPRGTYVIRNGRLYAGEAGDDEIIKCFRIKNWDALRNER